MMPHLFPILAAVLLALLTPLSAAEAINLRCEYLENPLGIDGEKPRFSWVIADPQSENSNLKSKIVRGVTQTAYQVLVASSPELLAKDQGDMWDSGKVEGDESIQVEYKGEPLNSRMSCFWKVRVWLDNLSVDQGWSKPARWTMGLAKPDDWIAKWIGFPADETSPWVRKEFKLDAKPKAAMIYVNVRGYYELYVNGEKVSDDVLSPAVSDLRKRSLYRTHDIGKLLRAGDNCIGLWFGRGWSRSGIQARAQIHIEVGKKM